jgi:hypothetical protein
MNLNLFTGARFHVFMLENARRYWCFQMRNICPHLA